MWTTLFKKTAYIHLRKESGIFMLQPFNDFLLNNIINIKYIKMTSINSIPHFTYAYHTFHFMEQNLFANEVQWKIFPMRFVIKYYDHWPLHTFRNSIPSIRYNCRCNVTIDKQKETWLIDISKKTVKNRVRGNIICIYTNRHRCTRFIYIRFRFHFHSKAMKQYYRTWLTLNIVHTPLKTYKLIQNV